MNYKRLEIYTGWKCNHRCTFCIEYPNMKREWDREVTEGDIMKKLLKYKKRGFNHVTFLGGEPFIHKVFLFSIKIAKKLGYTVMVTTNASMLQFDIQAKKSLQYIDQLIISIPVIDRDKQLFINRTKGQINFDNVFDNIHKYWHGNFLKVNTVINQDNLSEITEIINYVGGKGVLELSITYPDIIMPYYSKEFVLDRIAPTYGKVKNYLEEWIFKASQYNIHLKIVDIPFCNLGNIDNLKITDDYDYQERLKVDPEENEIDRAFVSPRRRKHINECEKCFYKNICWGPSIHYSELYGSSEIKAIT